MLDFVALCCAQNLSKNNLGHEGAVAVGDLLENDNELLYLDLSGKLYITTLYKCINFRYVIVAVFVAHSKNELIQWRGVRRLSICLSVRL